MCQIWSCPVANKTIPEITTTWTSHAIIALNSKSTTSGISRTTSDLRNNALVPHQGLSGYLHVKCLHVCFPWTATLFSVHGYSTEKIIRLHQPWKFWAKKHPAFWFPSTSLNYHLFFWGWFLSSFCAPLIQPGPHGHIFGLVRQCIFLHDPLTHRNNFWSTKRLFRDSFTPLPSTKNISIYIYIYLPWVMCDFHVFPCIQINTHPQALDFSPDFRGFFLSFPDSSPAWHWRTWGAWREGSKHGDRWIKKWRKQRPKVKNVKNMKIQ